ncbi:MAG: hypothetical protein ACO207_00470 [Bacilli bacterium]
MNHNKMSLVAIGGAALLVGCGLTAPSLPSNDVAPLPTPIKEVYAEKAVTGVSMLATTGFIQTANVSSGPLLMKGPQDAATLVTEEDLIAKFTEYITLMDSLLTEEGQPFQVVELPSDREAYTYHLSITVNDLAGNTMTYEMYFNVKEEVIEETTSSEVTSSEVEVTSEELTSIVSSEDLTTSDVTSSEITSSEPTSEPLARRDGDDEDEDELDEEEIEDQEDREEHDGYNDGELRNRNEENSYRDHHDRDFENDDEVLLEGVVIFEGQEYALLGIQEIDQEETETKFFISLDENNWIKIKREVEVDEQKYDLAMMKDGQFSKLTFKVETDDDGEIEVKLKTIMNDELVSYSFKKEIEEGVEIIKIKVVEDRQVLHVKAVPSIDENGETVYSFYVRESGKDYEGRPGHGRDGGRGH